MGKGRKAKIKKAKKNRREARRVCLHIVPRLNTQTHSSSQANIPRFLYSNSEITKRRDPVGINVRSPRVIHCRSYLATRMFAILYFTSSRIPHHRAGLEYRLVFPVRVHVLNDLMFPEPAKHSKTSSSPCSGNYVHRAFPTSPSHIRHREPQRPHIHSSPTRPTTAHPIFSS